MNAVWYNYSLLCITCCLCQKRTFFVYHVYNVVHLGSNCKSLIIPTLRAPNERRLLESGDHKSSRRCFFKDGRSGTEPVSVHHSHLVHCCFLTIRVDAAGHCCGLGRSSFTIWYQFVVPTQVTGGSPEPGTSSPT